MTDFPAPVEQAPPFVSTWSRFSSLCELRIANGGTTLAVASFAWGGANRGVFVPITIPFKYDVQRVFWINGSGTIGGNRSFGIFTFDGALIYTTGSVAASGASLPQFTAPSTAIRLMPGDYLFGMSCSVTTANNVLGSLTPTAELKRRSAIMEENAHPVGSPPTLIASTIAGVPLCGITWTPSGF